MRTREGSFVAGLALLVPLVVPLAAAPSGAVPAGAAPVGAAPSGTAPVVARHGTLTTHDAGYPTTPAPDAQIESAAVTQDVVGSRVRATVTLRAVPATPSVDLAVGFGTTVGGRCTADETVLTNTLTPTNGATRAGAVITLDRPSTKAASATWDCAAALTLPTTSTGVLDVVFGGLVPEHGATPLPTLTVGDTLVLRKKVSRLRLVRGAWTTLDVAVTNAPGASAEAAGLHVTGSGRGLKVRSSPVLAYPLSEGSTATFAVRVRLTAKNPRKVGPLTLVARSGEAAGERSLPVRSVKPVRRPVAGSYRAKGAGKVTFRIAGGSVVRFRTGRLRTRCGAAGAGPYTYLSSAYAFGRVKVGRDGLVHATERTDDYLATLQMKVVGAKVTQGYFSYYGPGGCFASVEFGATRRK